jgi:hypothetical protein
MRSRVIAAALALRGRAGYVDPATDDIPDPPATLEGFALCAERIGPALRAVVDALFPPPVPGG